MKLSAILPLCSLLLSGLAYGESVLLNQSSTQQNQLGQFSSEYVEARLKTITVTEFNIRKAPLSEAVAYLDTVVEPHGLQILFRPIEGREDPQVSLKTRSLTLSRNLSFLTQMGGYDWWVESGVIIVGMPESNEALVRDIIPIHSATANRFVKAESFR